MSEKQAHADTGNKGMNAAELTTQSASETVRDTHPIRQALTRFIQEVDSLAGTLPIVMLLVRAATQSEWKSLETYISQNGTDIRREKNTITAQMPFDTLQEYLNRQRKFDRMQAASRTIPRSFVTSLVSHYDAFLGALLRSLLVLCPELLNTVERQLTFKELTEFDSVEDAREYIVEKEVESVIRNSHEEQFKWMENRFKIELRKGLPSWSNFIEVTERRNLFVHCNGVVTSQYLKVCRQHNVPLGDVAVGHELRCPKKYFETAHEVIVEIGVKLAYVLWRKLRPDEREEADNALNDVSLNLIRDEKFHLAKTLLDFAAQQKKFGSESMRRILVLNRAQTYKWLGDQKAMQRILNSEDWTASNEKFQLAVAVLSDEFERAGKLMRRIGTTGTPNKGDYKEWPIFKDFRHSAEFASAYTDIFGEAYVESNAPPKEESDAGGDQAERTIQ